MTTAPFFGSGESNIAPGGRLLARWPAGRGGRAVIGSVSGLTARLVLAIVTLISVPLLLRHLGSDGYGIWATLTAGVAWLALAQFGLGPALLNRLSAIPDAESQRSVTWTAIWLSTALGAAVLIALVVALILLPWTQFLQIDPGRWEGEARAAAWAFAVGVAAAIPLGIPLAVLRARQEVYVANAIEAGASVARLVAVIILIDFGAGLGALAAGSTIAGLAVAGLGGLAAIRRRHAFGPLKTSSRVDVQLLLRSGAAFTSVSVAALLIMYSDPIVISQALGPSAVPGYVAAFTILTFFMSLGLAVLDAAWPAMTEAAATGDWSWLGRTLDRLVIVGLVGALIFGVVLVWGGAAIIDAWAGPAATPPTGLLPVLAAIALVQAVELPHGRLLVSLGRLREYAGFGLANAFVNLLLSIVLVRVLGTTGVAVATLVGYLVFGPGLIYVARRALRVARASELAGTPATP